ncbi:hypothetical protein ERJ75_001066500 [Trypanosoma vivax]|nr:hypothetical protein TRVL_10103 [Trypanosoma vivax]KAH8610923.1 hypothetical protein ERJ75_001066500 [Trypanosoma vivax]
MGLRSAMVSFELPKGGDFIRTFEATKECFQNVWRALEEGRSILFKQCEAARLQIHEECQDVQARFAAADGENNGLGQRIWQLVGQNRRMLEHARSLQAVNGALAAENGLLKAGGGGVHVATEARGVGAQRSVPNVQLPQQWAGTVFHAPAADEQQLLHDVPLATNVGFRGVQVFRDELSETSFKPEEKIRMHEGALG